jgi:hypothetical protein
LLKYCAKNQLLLFSKPSIFLAVISVLCQLPEITGHFLAVISGTACANTENQDVPHNGVHMEALHDYQAKAPIHHTGVTAPFFMKNEKGGRVFSRLEFLELNEDFSSY